MFDVDIVDAGGAEYDQLQNTKYQQSLQRKYHIEYAVEGLLHVQGEVIGKRQIVALVLWLGDLADFLEELVQLRDIVLRVDLQVSELDVGCLLVRIKLLQGCLVRRWVLFVLVLKQDDRIDEGVALLCLFELDADLLRGLAVRVLAHLVRQHVEDFLLFGQFDHQVLLVQMKRRGFLADVQIVRDVTAPQLHIEHSPPRLNELCLDELQREIVDAWVDKGNAVLEACFFTVSLCEEN